MNNSAENYAKSTVWAYVELYSLSLPRRVTSSKSCPSPASEAPLQPAAPQDSAVCTLMFVSMHLLNKKELRSLSWIIYVLTFAINFSEHHATAGLKSCKSVEAARSGVQGKLQADKGTRGLIQKKVFLKFEDIGLGPCTASGRRQAQLTCLTHTWAPCPQHRAGHGHQHPSTPGMRGDHFLRQGRLLAK